MFKSCCNIYVVPYIRAMELSHQFLSKASKRKLKPSVVTTEEMHQIGCVINWRSAAGDERLTLVSRGTFSNYFVVESNLN